MKKERRRAQHAKQRRRKRRRTRYAKLEKRARVLCSQSLGLCTLAKDLDRQGEKPLRLLPRHLLRKRASKASPSSSATRSAHT